jgi:hypothetical protein
VVNDSGDNGDSDDSDSNVVKVMRVVTVVTVVHTRVLDNTSRGCACFHAHARCAKKSDLGGVLRKF